MDSHRTRLIGTFNHLRDFSRLLLTNYKADAISIYIFEKERKQFKQLIRTGRDVFPRILKYENYLLFFGNSNIKQMPVPERRWFGYLRRIPGATSAVPIIANKELCGLLIVNQRKGSLPHKTLERLSAEARLLGVCLYGLDILKSMTQEITGLKVVDDINRIVATELNPERLYQRIYEQVRRLVKVNNLRIDLLELDGQHLKPAFFIHEGKHIQSHPYTNLKESSILAEIYNRRKVMLTSEYQRLLSRINKKSIDPAMIVASFIALPLVVRDNFLGVMLCWDKHRKYIFNRQKVRLLTLMANQSAIAIYNARLFEQLNKAINDLTLLHQIEYHISSILSIDTLLKTTVVLIDEALGDLITTVLIPDQEKQILEIRAMTPDIAVKPGYETIPFYRGIVGEAMRHKKTVYAPDVDMDEHYVPAIEGVKSEMAIPLMAGTRVLGVIDFQSKQPSRFDLMTVDLLEDIAHRIAAFLENAILYERIEKSFTDTIRALVLAMEAKDSYTRGHSERVTDLAIKLGDRMGITDGRKRVLYYAGLLHDIGKIGISETILNKPGKLDEFEFSEIKKHPVEGARMLEHIEGLREIVPIIKHHHENYDGTGYPDGLKADEIPMESRILAVCDVFDAMTTVRSYRKPFSKEEALRAIASFEGLRLDPKITAEFTKMMRKEIKKEKQR